MEKIGETGNDEATLLRSRYLYGYSCFALGECVAAHARFQQCHSLRKAADRAVYTSITVGDVHVLSLGYMALTLVYLGYIDQACARINEALSEASGIDHSYTRVWVLNTACSVKTIAGSAREAQRHDTHIALIPAFGRPVNQQPPRVRETVASGSSGSHGCCPGPGRSAL
jgi:hypothetical protein